MTCSIVYHLNALLHLEITTSSLRSPSPLERSRILPDKGPFLPDETSRNAAQTDVQPQSEAASSLLAITSITQAGEGQAPPLMYVTKPQPFVSPAGSTPAFKIHEIIAPKVLVCHLYALSLPSSVFHSIVKKHIRGTLAAVAAASNQSVIWL